MSRRHPAFTFDVDSALGLTGVGARILAVLFVVTQVTLAVTSNGAALRGWQEIAALVLMIGAAALVVAPGPFPLRMPWTVAILAVVALTTVLVEATLPARGWPGYAAWHFGANTFLLLAVALRGRPGWAWLGMAIMSALTVVWSMTTGQGILSAVNLLDRQAGTLLIGTLFAYGLKRTMLGLQIYTDAEDSRAAAEQAASAALEVRGHRLARLEKNVVPALRAIAAGETLEHDERNELLIIEARLRDTIRGGVLAAEPLISSATQARRRGVDLVLLDDTGAERWAIDATDIVPWIAEQLDRVSAGSFTARIAPDAHGRAVVTIVADQIDSSLERVPASFVAGDRADEPAQ